MKPLVVSLIPKKYQVVGVGKIVSLKVNCRDYDLVPREIQFVNCRHYILRQNSVDFSCYMEDTGFSVGDIVEVYKSFDGISAKWLRLDSVTRTTRVIV